MNYVVDEVKRSRKEDVSILTHPHYDKIHQSQLDDQSTARETEYSR